MKKIIFGLTLLSIIFMTTGCVKYSYEISINDKDELYLTQTKAVNMDILKTVNPDFKTKFDTMFKAAISKVRTQRLKTGDKALEAELYSEDGYKGVTFDSRHLLSSFTKDNLPAGFTSENEQPVQIKKSLLGKTEYSIRWQYSYKDAMNADRIRNKDFDDEISNSFDELGIDLGQYKPSAELVIRVPYNVTNHNALKVINKKRYYWNLMTSDKVPVVLEYELPGYEAVAATVAGFLILLCLIIIWYRNKE